MASGGALSFLTVDLAQVAVLRPGGFTSDWIAPAPQRLSAGPAIRLPASFADAVSAWNPSAAALQSGDTGRLFQLLAGAGGAPVVQGLLPQMLGAQSSQQIMQGINGGGGQLSALPTGGADPRGKIPVITAAAQKYGVDPAVALRVAQSEGLGSFYGDGGRSGGAFQLYTRGGLGNEFQKETGLDPLDQKNEDATIDWAMKNVARTGWSPYKGAAKVGIGPRQGIGVQTAAQPGQQPAAPVGTSPVADEEPLPAVEQPAGGDLSKAPFMAAGATPSRGQRTMSRPAVRHHAGAATT